MGGARPKQFLEIGGVPLWVHTVRQLLAASLIEAVVLVVPKAEQAETAAAMAAHDLNGVIGPVAGGATRQESVRQGILAVPDGFDVIAVHDAARPFPDPERLDRAIRQAAKGTGVVVGRPAHDTIKRVDDNGRIVDTLDRSTLWQAFTPQVFPAKMIAAAYDSAHRDGYTGTDDASLVERLGEPVQMLAGGREALKVTTPEDLETARDWLDRDRSEETSAMTSDSMSESTP
ncbi:MAG: 2-C-methyl-D-erythritol 4-phosphate cytidylyltransferase [Leptospirillia bacterium]